MRPANGHVIFISYLTTVEMVSLLLRKQKTGRIAPTVIQKTQDNFLKHVETRYLVSTVDNTILGQARSLVVKHDLRTLDAVQLMCAIDMKINLGQPITFLSSDKNLLAAAQNEGFNVDDPNLHP